MNLALDTLAEWRKKKSSDSILEKDLKNLKKEKDIQDAFGKKMEFGTAGIRGILGAGTNRINIYTIGAAAQAYAEYLINNVKNAKNLGIVIGHDNRHNNILFTEEVAKVMSFYKIKTYMFAHNKLQPTPIVSYAIRKLKAAGGVIITASHNPAQYNGFKVYNELGGQLMPSETKKIFEYMNNVDFLNINQAKLDPIYINNNLIEEYINDVLSIRRRVEDDKVLKVVYSPLHGTGSEIGPQLIRRMNINCSVVKSQMINDPNFSKTKSPNPEECAAYKKGIALARYKKADLVLLTDPDSDRIGVVCKYKRRYKYMTGNQIACIYLLYMLSQMKLNNEIPENAYIVKSNVSSDLATAIARKYGVKVYETHVGFKNIADLIEQKKNEKFLFAFEESYGFLVNPNISRDKDAMQGLVAIIEAANYFKTQHSSMFNELLKIEKQFEFYRNVNDSVVIDQAAIDRLFARLLTRKTLGDVQIIRIDDYRKVLNGLEPANMLKVYLKDYGWFAIRPSGTEPKVKYYFNLKSNNIKEVIILEKAIKNDLEDITEDTEITKISRKTILKFSFFLLILGTILIVLLFTVYETGGSHGAVSIFVEIWNLMRHANKFWLFMLVIAQIIPLFITSCFAYRALKFLKQPIPYRRALTANFLSLCISAITPFSIGGAVASYWYLRRKGLPRKELLASYMMNSLIYQFSISIRTFIFIPIGFWLFSGIFFAGTISSILILTLTFIGFAFDIIATIMIGLLTLNKRLQTRIVGTTITFLEWLPFVMIADPIKISSRYEYEFHSMRIGMRQLLSHKPLMLELILYEITPIFISGYLFGALAIGVSTNAQLPGGLYINFITGTNLIRSANNMIPLPGGSGTTEWMSQQIYSKIFTGMGNQEVNSAEFTGLIRLWTYIFPMGGSSLALILVYINERINAKVNSQNKNISLQELSVNKSKNRFKFWTLFVLVPTMVAITTVFIVLLFI